MAVDVRLNHKDMRKLERMLRPLAQGDAMDRLIVSCLNRTAKKTRTRAVRVLAQRTGQPQKEIRPNVVIGWAKRNDQVATLTMRGRPKPISQMDPRQMPGGVSYAAKGGRAMLDRAFIATMGTGYTGVFLREPAGGTGSRWMEALSGSGPRNRRRRARRMEAFLSGYAGRQLVGRLPIFEPRVDPISAAVEAFDVADLVGDYAREELYNQINMAIARKLKGGQLVWQPGRGKGYTVRPKGTS